MKLIHVTITVIFCFLAFSINDCISDDPPNSANEDTLDDEATVESDEKTEPPKESETVDPPKQDDSALQDQGPVDEMPDGLPKPSASVETRMVFIEPSIGQIPRASPAQKSGNVIPLDVPVGVPVNVLISFQHKGGIENKDGFLLDAVSACLRYPMDYNYYIQNFTARRLNELSVEPLKKATLDYSFTPAQQLMGRPYGLTVRVFYHDQAGQSYVSTVMNETVQLVEYESSPGAAYVDTEAIFLYIVILGLFLLFLISLYQLWMSYGPKRLTKSMAGKLSKSSGAASNDKSKSKVSNAKDDEDDGRLQEATANAIAKGVDPEWIPKDVLLRDGVRKSPGIQTSPKSRKNRRE